MVEFPNVRVQLNEGANVYEIIATVSNALKRAGHREAADKFKSEAMQQGSYEDVIQLAKRTVDAG